MVIFFDYMDSSVPLRMSVVFQIFYYWNKQMTNNNFVFHVPKKYDKLFLFRTRFINVESCDL